DLFDHFTQLVDLDWENAAIRTAVAELLHRCLEGPVDRFNSMAKQILEANHERKSEPPFSCFLHHLEQIDRATGILERFRNDVPSAVDREISVAPGVDIVGRD